MTREWQSDELVKWYVLGIWAYFRYCWPELTVCLCYITVQSYSWQSLCGNCLIVFSHQLLLVIGCLDSVLEFVSQPKKSFDLQQHFMCWELIEQDRDMYFLENHWLQSCLIEMIDGPFLICCRSIFVTQNVFAHWLIYLSPQTIRTG